MNCAGQAIGLTAWPRESRGEAGAGEIFRRRGRDQRDLAWAGRRGRGARDLAAAGSMPSSARTTPHRLVTVTVVLGGVPLYPFPQRHMICPSISTHAQSSAPGVSRSPSSSS